MTAVLLAASKKWPDYFQRQQKMAGPKTVEKIIQAGNS